MDADVKKVIGDREQVTAEKTTTRANVSRESTRMDANLEHGKTKDERELIAQNCHNCQNRRN
jgi:hypothetical protein